MLEVRSLTKRFGKKTALDDINFVVDKKIYGLIGPNGAGKTTLLRCIVGLYKLPPESIVYDGNEIDKLIVTNNILIGYLPQKFGLFKNLTVMEALEFIATLKRIEKTRIQNDIKIALEQVNLSKEVNNKVKTLSGGMLRRLGIAQAILGSPEIIILDEPTSGLDPEERMRFKTIISKLQGEYTVIISTHIVSDLEALCDELIIMDKGKIITSGSCDKIRELADNHCYEINETEKHDIIGDYYVRHQYTTGQSTKLNVICSESQTFCMSHPTTEDGYIWALKFLRRDSI